MAKEGALDELLAEVLSRYDNSPNPRLKEVMNAFVKHMHAFVREVRDLATVITSTSGMLRRPVAVP